MTPGPEDSAKQGNPPWVPLAIPAFRTMWLMWFVTNMCMWMSNVSAAWLMATLSPVPLWVALVQAATTLPVLVLALPFGTLADRADRGSLLALTQGWLCAIALLQAALSLAGLLTAPALLATTLAFGCGFAMRLPVFAATVPQLVHRDNLPAALALNAASMNAARILGPLAAGAMLPLAGSAGVFVVVALLSLVSLMLVRHAITARVASVRQNRPFLSSLQDGLALIVRSPAFRGVLLRISSFFISASALPALLPLVARSLPGGGPATFTSLLAAMGAGAVASLAILQRLRERLRGEVLALLGTAAHSVAMLVVAFAPSRWIAGAAMFVAGVAWLSTSNPLTVRAQLLLPDELRARGMAIHQMAMMGSSALGAALWGQVATWTDVPIALSIAAFAGVAAMATAHRIAQRV